MLVKMSFSSAGEFRVVIQQYKYGSHQIFCVVKILPDRVSFFEKEPEIDFNWMTAARWAKVESGLWRLLAGITNWQEDAHKLNAQMLIDHIKVSVSSSTELLVTAQKLLKNEVLAQNDLGLEVVLRYMSHEDKPVSTPLATKRRHADKAKTNQVEKNGSKVKPASASASSAAKKKPEPKISSLEPQPADETPRSKRPDSGLSKKRERRSISQGSPIVKDVPRTSKTELTVPRGRAGNRSKTPPSRSTSAEPKAERRSARSPVKPGRFNEFVLSATVSRKVKTKLSDNISESSAEKGASKKPVNAKHKQTEATVANGNSKNWKFEQLDGARINMSVLKKLNDMLDIPKPREVQILLLKEMDETAVLNTFETYRTDFDQLFKEREHKYQTTSYMTIDHCHIMDILSNEIRDSMIKKLAEVYSKTGPHGSLVINGLLPLWIIRLFMDRYKLTQEEAVRQISDQLKYYTYLKALNNEPLSSDLED